MSCFKGWNAVLPKAVVSGASEFNTSVNVPAYLAQARRALSPACLPAHASMACRKGDALTGKAAISQGTIENPVENQRHRASEKRKNLESQEMSMFQYGVFAFVVFA